MKRINLSGPMGGTWVESREFQMYETLNSIVDKLEELEIKIEALPYNVVYEQKLQQ